VHVDKRMKLVPLGYKGIYVGYNETSKAYIMLVLLHWKTFVRIYVKFKEKLVFRRSKESSGVTMDEEHQALKNE
jgi:hypothetical protein